MKDLVELVENLKHKSKILTEKYRISTEENKQLSVELDGLRKELNYRTQQVKEMEDKIKILKISKAVENESTKDVKLKINEMVREIDKCIALINK